MAAKLKNIPTPKPTHNINVVLGIAVICDANTFKSGSAIVIIIPTINATNAISADFFVFTNVEAMI